MSEDEQVDLEQEAGQKGKGEGSRGSREAATFRSQALSQMQRGRKALGAEDGGPAADYHIRSATVLALLELADAVRSGKSAL